LAADISVVVDFDTANAAGGKYWFFFTYAIGFNV